ncbi:MAG: tRNA uridine(34) 5-carboxymethylaminomethyl modification radical SAM/GNAT enzyme Elp3 [Nitrososphaerota archaeon]|nr:tRNA uridine(34) 5-carboxymethylaminomethyl modification radical SAM/GNAT enzyme Elp3 [Nitrososphaerota archaeon]MDG6967432.1 tRNA uridine(34) 5-carboxymethylaminomethyl modification radical SAM/GNAT enzyme Elp3 [Nitrososphaerota archaeon]MDG6979445.1 tRNA uridine(34) 5-carboxymethylaminomethyl modification radical SAM/GNAT enzyme Elp3 [Nitrososphaerota archaeon]
METVEPPSLSGGERAAIASIVRSILSGEVTDRAGLERAKKQAAARHGLARFLSNSEIYLALSPAERDGRKEIFRVHPRRSASGIVIVTVFTAPASCPHGTCVYCPGGPSSGTPQSYVPDGPSMRGARAVGFDPYLQAQKMLNKYLDRGHEASKVELMVEGGTFLAMPRDYQEWFVKGAFDGLNCAPSQSLEEAHAANEGAAYRSVGLTVETKPDWCRPEHVDTLLSYGVTKVEIGVQSLRDEVLARSNRGHSVEDTLRALQVARDSGLKVCAHMMPGLPGSSPEDDLADLLRLFEDEALRPDMMKLYPTTVVKGTALARMCEAGLYSPYDLETVVGLIAEMKAHVPPWHRIMRIQREIPEADIAAGSKAGNLRELVLARVRERGGSCGCIRCREVAMDSPGDDDDDLELRTLRYAASGGTEVFASYEYAASGKLAGFVRMRAPSERAHRPELAGGACTVRELKVYGRVVAVGSRDARAFQHRGLGRSLLEAMEKEARESFGARTLLVTSAVGTRNYYRKFGYERRGPYVGKELAR